MLCQASSCPNYLLNHAFTVTYSSQTGSISTLRAKHTPHSNFIPVRRPVADKQQTAGWDRRSGVLGILRLPDRTRHQDLLWLRQGPPCYVHRQAQKEPARHQLDQWRHMDQSDPKPDAKTDNKTAADRVAPNDHRRDRKPIRSTDRTKKLQPRIEDTAKKVHKPKTTTRSKGASSHHTKRPQYWNQAT